MRLPSDDQHGLPATPPVFVTRRIPLPSGWTMYIPVDWSTSHCPGNVPGVVSRSELKAIQAPSGDHAGRKFTGSPVVRAAYFLVARSSRQRLAVPEPRVE